MMSQEIRKVCIDVTFEEEGNSSYVVLEEYIEHEYDGEVKGYDIIYQAEEIGDVLKYCLCNLDDEDELFIPETISEILILDAQEKLAELSTADDDDEIDLENPMTQIILDKIIRAIQEEFNNDEKDGDYNETEDY